MNYVINFFNYMYKIISFIQGMVNIYNFYNIHNKILTPPVKNDSVKNDSIIESLSNIKSSSITFEIFFKNLYDNLAQSLIDYITSRPNIKSILYTNNNFRLNHKMPVLIDEDI